MDSVTGMAAVTGPDGVPDHANPQFVASVLNKQVGIALDTSEITVKAHRGKVMQKMKANSFAHLVATAARLGIGPSPQA